MAQPLDYLLASSYPERYDRIEKEFKSPISHYPVMENGNFKISKIVMEAGRPMEMITQRGFIRYETDIELTVLKENNKLWMSDRPSELQDMENLARYAKGNVVVAGLGLGVLIHILDAIEEVESITVVEINHDLIEMISPLLPPKARVIEDDWHQWIQRVEENYDYYILDIWPDICEDNFRGMLDAWEAIKNKKKEGGIWGMERTVDMLLDKWRGYDVPSEFAWAAYNAGYPEIGEFIEERWDDADYEDDEDYEFYGEEECAMDEFFRSIGLDI